MKITIHTNRHGLLATSLAALCCAPAASQETPETPLAEPATVVVTGLKSMKAKLDTPTTVTVLSADDLKNANISSALQLSGVVPGYFSAEGTSGNSASFRGLGSNASDPSIEASVGMFVDGIYLGHARDYTMPLFDVRQVEFIAGTASTILGKNTSLGAVSVANRRPKNKLGYNVSYTGTSVIDGHKLEAGVDVPLSDAFALRVVGYANQDRGFIDNLYTKKRAHRTEEKAGRLVLQGHLNSTNTLMVSYQRDHRSVEGQPTLLLTDPHGVIGDLAGQLGQTGFIAGSTDGTYLGSDRLDPGDPALPLPRDRQNGHRATAILESELPGDFSLTAQTSVVRWRSTRENDLDFTVFRLLNMMDDEDNRVFSQELRLASPKSDQFNYLAGLFYYKNTHALRRSAGSDLGTSLDSLTRVKDTSLSAFASGSYALTSAWAMRAGLRQTREGKKPTYLVEGTPDFVRNQIPLTTLATQYESQTDSNVGLDYQAGRGTLLYANWSRGSKGGGFQSRPDSLAVAHFGPEVAHTIELGAKFNFQRNGYLEVALFDTVVKGFQTARLVIVPPATLPETLISNADARSTGAEINGVWNPTRDLSLNGNLTYADSRFTSDLFNDDGSGVSSVEIYRDMPLPRAPKVMAQAGVKYRTAVRHDLELSTQATVRYAGTTDLQFRSRHPTAPKAEAHATFDLVVSLSSKPAGWTLALLGNNLSNKRYTTFASEHVLGGDAYYGTRNRPRTMALRLTYEM